MILLFVLISSSACSKEDDIEQDPEGNAEQGDYSTFISETPKSSGDGVINVMTYNLRIDKVSDGENRWEYRKDRVVELLSRHNPDIIGFQEDSYAYVSYLINELKNEGYDWIGYGSKDGKNAKENPDAIDYLNSIFFNSIRFELVEHGVFWYADEPSRPNAEWSNGYYRTCIWARFREKSSGVLFYHFNTHFHHQEESVRVKQAELLINEVQIINENDLPAIFTGDFNTEPGSTSYRTITESTVGYSLKNSKSLSTEPHEGTNDTAFGFASGFSGSEIDHIFLRNIEEVNLHKTINDYTNWNYPSDHCPVITQIKLPVN
jgi:endonuclease/exonuclease/phosphatase family metal-dependent hydrolase